MRKNFPVIMNHVFQWEGGYVDHPQDPGGATNMGITIHTMRALKLDLDNDGDIDKDDVKLVTKGIATEIYDDMYWTPVWGNRMPSGLDMVLMDAAVNSGPRASVRWLQKALKDTKADGYLGPNTWESIVSKSNDIPGLVKEAIDERLKSVRQFRKYPVFGRGWENRIASVLHRATELAKNG